MLDTGSKEQLVSYLSSDLGVTSLTEAESGLSIQLLANCSYYINLLVSVETAGDGMRYNLLYTGTNGIQGMVYTDTNLAVTTGFYLNSSYASPGFSKVFMAEGILTTGNGGRLYLAVRKDTDTTDTSIISSGAHLVARRI